MQYVSAVEPGLFANRTESELRETTDNLVEAMHGGPKGDGEEILFSLRGVYESLVHAKRMDANLTEANTSSVFNTVSRTIVVDGVIEGYASVPRIGRDLVNVIPTPGKKTGRLAGVTTDAEIEEVLESEEYKAAGMSDKYVTYANKKYGRHIPITVEAVMEDQTGEVLDKARSIGEILANFEEKKILNAIMDIAGYKGYNPAGVSTTLYSATATESKTQAPAANLKATNALADWTDIDNAWQLLGTKIGENGDPIAQGSNISLLAPWALRGTGQYIVNNQKDTRATVNADAPATTLAFPDGSRYSPWLDLQSASTWFFGDFKQQFTKTSYWDLKTKFIDGANDASMQLRDIFGTYLASIYFDVIARDFRFVIKNTA
ncbi:unnamed protein product [marine sediment metagenome]|uniref:Bacteriophage Mu GpT domain-containing protein n=1 Tax=marine sediment metagenome TaxID=412755 RepID=X0S312_9ZZZZ